MLKENYWLSLPILVLFYQVFFLSHYGFSTNDYGYLFGMGWRILNGQEIYLDFLYARPPLSPYMTAFWIYVLPEDGLFYYARVVNHIYGFTTAVLIFLVIRRFFRDFLTPMSSALIVSLILIFNVNYVVHFWHTTDGLLMATISLFFLAKKNKPKTVEILIGVLFMILAMLTKQSFYPLPFALSIFMFFMYGKAIVFRFIGALVFLGLSFYAIAYFGFSEQLAAYLDFKQSKPQVGPFIEAAFTVYFLSWIGYFPALLLIVFVANGKYLFKYFKRKQFYKFYSRTMLFYSRYFILIYGLLLLQYAQMMINEGVSMDVFHLPLISGLVIAVVWITIEAQQKKIKGRNVARFALIFLFMSIAWMSSLSWGYKTPALYSGTIIFFFIYLNYYYTQKRIDNIYLFGVLIMYLATVTVIQYGDITKSSKYLGGYSSKLNGIYAGSEAEFISFTHVDKAVKECKDRNATYAVVSNHPYAHFLNNDYPTLSLDWVSNVEMLNKKERLIREISEVDCVIVDPYYKFWDNELFGFDLKKIANIDFVYDKELIERELEALNTPSE